MAEKRSATIDIYKGIGIVLVMMGHIGFGAVSSYIAHAFHMPMFFFISGFLYQEKKEVSFKEWLQRKAGALLVPYLLFGVLNYIFWILIQFQKGESISLSPIFHLLFVNTTGLASGSLWFLTALFITNVIFYLINKYVSRSGLQALIIIIVAHLGILSAELLPFRLPYAMDAGMVGVGMFYAGYLMKKYEDKKIIYHLFHLPLWELVAGIVFISFLILQHGEINMRTGTYHNIALFWINAIAGSVLIYNLAAQIEKLKNCGFVLRFIVNLGEAIGRNSLLYVCMNDLINVEILLLLGMLVTEKSKLITAVTHSLALLLAIAVIEIIIRYTPIVKLMERFKTGRMKNDFQK